VALFEFQSPHRERISPAQWVAAWSTRFNTNKYPEGVYRELVEKGIGLSDADFEVLGAWKDGALKISPLHRGLKFGNCWVSFTGIWSAKAASCAYTVWQKLESRSALAQYLSQEKYRDFLVYLAQQQYTKASKTGAVSADFGLARATYVLHMFSRAKFPIYDKNTHAGIYLLTQGRYGSGTIRKTKTGDADWYLKTFCVVIRDLQET